MKQDIALTAIKNSVVWANRWSVFPIQWNDAEKKAALNHSILKWILWGLSVTMEVVNMIYLIAKAIEMHINESTDLIGKTFVEFLIVAYFLKLSSLHGFFCTQPQLLINFINMVIVSHRNMNEGRRVQVGKKCEMFVRGLLWIYLPAWAVFCAPALFQPNNPGYITSMTPNLWMKVPLFFVHVYLVRTWWACVHLLFVALAIHIFASVTTMNRIRSNALTIENVQRTYRSLQIFQQRCNATYGWPLAFMKISWVMTALRNMHSAVRGGGLVLRAQQVNSFIVTMTFLHVMFKAMGKLNDTSVEFLLASRKLREDRWFRRFFRSCRKLRVDIGNMYYVDRGMTLTLYTFLIQNTVNLLISDRKA